MSAPVATAGEPPAPWDDRNAILTEVPFEWARPPFTLTFIDNLNEPLNNPSEPKEAQ